MKTNYSMPEHKRLRLIINTDAKNEADDQYAIVHALLTPKFDIRGIIAAHFGKYRFGTVPVDDSMEQSYDEINKVLRLMDLEGKVTVKKGAEEALVDESTPLVSDGARLIVEEALKADEQNPLYVIFLGPITDLAAAYLMEPSIEDKVTAVWIGGGKYPEGGREFNLSNDINAANVIMKSNIELWQVPINTYRLIRTSIAELELKVRPHGELGKYLFDQLAELNSDPAWPLPFGESWCLGDSPAVSLLVDDHDHHYREIAAPRITKDMRYVHYQKERKIRVYDYVDPRFTLDDMFSKIAVNFPAEKEKV
ncbi:nucleoside hydrolase [Aquibacillus albus]|uniref:Inosine-uridine nucleoside N-ribohydrolase n=1 Tax=Aquibacillus albus TaxID=1168171 RepID=A0ABS2MXK4_9BACI|nr:inosine-uridine nucleoside N-ribohydrolase [Aquibacillus albus]